VTGSSTTGKASTRVSRTIKAERQAVYNAFLDPKSVATWMVPDMMSSEVQLFEAREGGQFRISLKYKNPGHASPGKTSADTDTFQGSFVELVPYTRIVEAVEFQS